MAVENTDLERRVLAHEQILQALMAQLEERDPGLLDRMRDRFTSARRGAHEHDYVETADHAEAFLHEVMRLSRGQAKPITLAPQAAATLPTSPTNAAARRAVVIRTAAVGGVWHVTQDGVFLGDYLAEGPARNAAADAARQIAAGGGTSELVFVAQS